MRNFLSYLINPYATKNLKKNQEHINHLFTDSIIPKELELVGFRSAIPKRNQFMVDKSDYIITFVVNDCGGAYKTFQYAKQKSNISIIDLSKLISNDIAISKLDSNGLIFVGKTESKNNDPCIGYCISSLPMTKKDMEKHLKEHGTRPVTYVLPYFGSEEKIEYTMIGKVEIPNMSRKEKEKYSKLFGTNKKERIA